MILHLVSAVPAVESHPGEIIVYSLDGVAEAQNPMTVLLPGRRCLSPTVSFIGSQVWRSTLQSDRLFRYADITAYKVLTTS